MATIRKRTWVWKGATRNAWLVDYRDNAGHRRFATFTTRKAANAWAVTALHEVQQGTHTPASTSITVAEGLALWIDAADGLEHSTIKQRREHKCLHIDPFIGAVKLSALTTPRVYAFDKQLRDAGRSLAMRRKVLTSLKMMLTHCQRTGRVAQNVALPVRIRSDDQRDVAPIRAGVDFPSRDELRTILDRAEGRRALAITFIFTGMRASEVRGLPWANVDLDAGMIHVRQRADLWGRIGRPKSKAGNRDIPLAPMAVNALRAHRQSHGGKLVFPDDQGNVASHDDLLRWFRQLQRANGIRNAKGAAKYGLHALRHAAASLFIAHLGWTPKRVQTVMGHSSIQMTFDLYGHLFEDREADRAAMQKLEDAIGLGHFAT